MCEALDVSRRETNARNRRMAARLVKGLARLLGIRSEIQRAFRNAGWPDPTGPDVAVDSEHRVDAGGGWNYFRWTSGRRHDLCPPIGMLVRADRVDLCPCVATGLVFAAWILGLNGLGLVSGAELPSPLRTSESSGIPSEAVLVQGREGIATVVEPSLPNGRPAQPIR